MKRNIVHDERVINERRKITNEAFSIVMFFLVASILIQQFVFKAAFSEYATEFICFFGGMIYILIRNISVGNNLTSTVSNKFFITNSLVSGIVITAVTGYRMLNDNISTNEIIFTLISVFAISTISSLLSFFTITKLNQRKIKKLEDELDKDENFEE